MSEHEVFISYARRSSREHAAALHLALAGAGIDAFLDTDAIEDGDRFPQRLVDGVLDARVVVIFADPVYFQRWYCIREMNLALAAYGELVRRSADDAAKQEALAGVVVALAPGADLRNLPPGLAKTQWPPADAADRLVERVQAALAASGETFRVRSAGMDALREHMLEEMAVPQPRNLRGETTLVPASLDPSIGDSFVGRADDLWRLHLTLSTTRAEAAIGAALTASIEGGGGFGKTRLAREYLWRFADAYPGGWFWIDAEVDDLLLEQRHYDILKALDGDVSPLKSLRESGTDVGELLAEALRKIPATEPALLVVDNVPEPTPGEPPQPLTRWCPALGVVTVLATSRWKASVALKEVETVELDTLAPEAAVLMLRDDAAVPLSDDEWHELAAWVGHLPLALEVLNAALRLGGVGGQEMLDAARSAGPATGVDALADALRGQVPEGALRGIRDALSLSYDSLSPAAQEGARLLAMLAPEPVPTALVAALGLTPAVRTALRSRSIVSSVAEHDVEMYGRMHRVMADFLRAQGGRDLAAVVAALTSVMTYVACQDPGQWPLMLALVPHIERSIADIEGEEPEAEVDLRLRLGMLFWSAGLASRALGFEREAVRIAEAQLGKEHPDTVTALSNLAGSLWSVGDAAAAKDICERVVEARRRVMGENHPATLSSLNNLAETLSAVGDAVGAKEIHERVVKASRRVLGEEHPNTLRSLSNLATTLRVLGDAAGAKEIYLRVVDARRRVLGEEHPDTLKSLSNLASTLSEMGDVARAKEIDERVVVARRRVLGEEHPDTLTSLANLAVRHAYLGELGEASAALRDVVDASSRALGESHPSTVVMTRSLANVLRELGDDTAAADLDRRADDAERQRDS